MFLYNSFFTVLTFLCSLAPFTRSYTQIFSPLPIEYVQTATMTFLDGSSSFGPSASMTFTSTYLYAFNHTPHFAYAISKLQTSTQITVLYYRIYKNGTSSNSTHLTIILSVGISTQLLLCSIRYIAVDYYFPYEMYLFQDVSIYYGQTNTSKVYTRITKGSGQWINNISFTDQATLNGYTNLSCALPNDTTDEMSMQVYVTTLYLKTDDDSARSSPFKIYLFTNLTIINETHYRITALHSTNMYVSGAIYFCMVFISKSSLSGGVGIPYFAYMNSISVASTGGYSQTACSEYVSQSLMGGMQNIFWSSTSTILAFNITFLVSQFGKSCIYVPVFSSITTNYTGNFVANINVYYFYIGSKYCPGPGLFYNSTLNKCQSCQNVASCLSCSGPTNCTNCYINNGYYFDTSYATCILCSSVISHCSICSVSTQCTTCDESNQYFLNTSQTTTVNSQCVYCPVSYCVTCLNFSGCSTCDNSSGYGLSSTDLLCYLCSSMIPNCLYCTTSLQCLICDESNQYFLNTSATDINYQCIPCPIQNCSTCHSFTTCSKCDPTSGYTSKQLTTVCNDCANQIPHCKVCNSTTQCVTCDQSNQYFLNETQTSVSLQCLKCPVSYCKTCYNLTACSVCDSTNGYILNPTTLLCQLCSSYIPNCLYCSSTTQCTTCLQTNQYFLNTSQSTVSLQCILCPVSYCLTCNNFTTCLSCDPTSGYVLNPDTLLCQPCGDFIIQCVICSSTTQCVTCNQTNQYFLDVNQYNVDLQCILCPITNCKTCSSISTCSLCNTGYLNYQNTSCLSCSDYLANCYTCSSKTVCTLCVSPYILDSSSKCVQKYTTHIVTASILFIDKANFQNQVQIRLKVTPVSYQLWKSIWNLVQVFYVSNFQVVVSQEVYVNQDSTISIIMEYNSTIFGENMNIKVEPAKTGKSQFVNQTSFTLNFKMIPTTAEMTYLYSQQTYNFAYFAYIVVTILFALCLFVYLISMFTQKTIGVQMLSMFQLSYISLVSLPTMNPVVYSLTQNWFINGFNYFALDYQSILVTSNTNSQKALYLYPQILQNLNASLVLIIIPLIVSGVVMVLKKMYATDENRTRFVAIAIKSGFQFVFNGYLFCGYIFGASLALQIKYTLSTKTIQSIMDFINIGQIGLYFIGLIIYFVFLLKFPIKFGDFVQQFSKKQDNPNLSFRTYHILLVQRILVSCILVMFQTFAYISIVPIVTCIFLMIRTIAARPYKTFKNNIRFIVNMCFCVIIQLMYLLYKIQNQDVQAQYILCLLFPTFVCGLLFISILYSFVLMAPSLNLFPTKISPYNNSSEEMGQQSSSGEVENMGTENNLENKSTMDDQRSQASKISIKSKNLLQQTNVKSFKHKKQKTMKKLPIKA